MAQDPFAAIAEPATQGDPFAAIAEPQQAAQSTHQTPGFFKRLLAPDDPGAQEFAEKHPVLGVPVRALSAAGGALLGTAPAVYHAFADPATEEEKARYAEGEKAAGEAPGTETSGLKRIGLGVRRLTVDPVVEAGKAYAAGEVTPGGAMSVLPEALGTAVGSVAGSELTSRVGGAISKPVTAPAEAILSGAKRAGAAVVNPILEKAGVSARVPVPEPEPGAVQGFVRKATGVESSVKDAVKAAGKEQVADLEKNAAARDLVAKRAELAKTVDQQSADLGNAVKKIEAGVGKEANAKFRAVREKVGNPEVPAGDLVATVRHAEQNILNNIPENIKEFRSIVGHGEEAPTNIQDAATAHPEIVGGEGLQGAEPITWDKLQSLKSRIDERLRQSYTHPLNGDLTRALYAVRDGVTLEGEGAATTKLPGVVNKMDGIAQAAGAGEMWTDAKNFYRQYKEDFHEPQGPSDSGSPVAKAVKAVDAKNIRQPFVAKQDALGNRGIDILRKYPQHGGVEAADLATQMLQNHKEMLQTGIGPNKPMPPVPAAPPVDIHQVALDAIEKRSRNWGQFNARDVGILASSAVGGIVSTVFGHNPYGGAIAGVIGYEAGKYTLSRLSNNPAVVEWMAKTPQSEIAVLRKIPNVDKLKIMDGITEVAMQNGVKTRLSPQLAGILGPENVHKIIMAGGAISGAQIQNRKDALKALGREPAPVQ